MGALCCVGRRFGCAGRAGPGWAWDLALLGALGWVGRGIWPCWARLGLGVGFGCWAAALGSMRPEIATQPITDEHPMHGGATARNEMDPSSNELTLLWIHRRTSNIP